MARIPPEMTRRARESRNHPTDSEIAIWHKVAYFRPRFTRQLVVERFIVDLACREVRLAVEFDGSQHIDSVRDAERTRRLEALGWTVIRFWNSDVARNPDGVAETILASVVHLQRPTHPQPLPSREGS
ncbi:endonuclease domain-containing protein [Sphingomonas sp. OK281]|uniref:endonuclease domain-containing protein n=1 Tax=Sphingomonas sp. OK281 TaxID=1881067 RepID=UPI0008E855A8|nr:DUF559 domain-containing protein [Sphingomonas sp. OK281]SFO16046.1 Very-short-patch-repair endonuclease [Sphingomonas sp. OK281]